MSKRRSDTQLTKDDYEAQMNSSFDFAASRAGNSEGGGGGGGRDEADPSKMADSKVMLGRKIAPLKKGRGRGGAATGARGGGSNIPNFFADTPSPAFGSNGNAQQPADGGMSGFGGFGTPNAASSTPAFGGNATGGGLGFGSGASEQPKMNPFGSLAPSTPSNTNGSGGMFGQPQMGSSLFGSTPAQNAAPGGIFGNNNNTPASASASASTPAPASSGFMFGGNNSSATATQSPATGFSKTPAFSFGGGSTASPMFGGDNKPATSTSTSTSFNFGSTGATPTVIPPVASSFNFGSATPASGSFFGAPSPAPEKTTEPPVTPAPPAPPSFQFGTATPTQGPTLFGKATDSHGSSLFGKPVETGSSLFAKSAESQASSLFGQPSPSPEPSSSGLFTPRKPTPSPEPPNHFAPAPTTPNFFGVPKAQETPKQLFGGFGEHKQELAKDVPKILFGGFSPAIGREEQATDATSPFSFGAPGAPPAGDDNDSAMAGNSPPKQSIYDTQPVMNNAFPSFSTTPTKPAFAAAPAPAQMFPPVTAKTTTSTTATSMTTNNIRTSSPPLPSDAPSWTPAQLTEYYNLYALRSLNYSFAESLKKMGSMGDYSGACLVYINESAKIRASQENGERYKGIGVKYSGLSSKRAGGEEVEGNVKRRKEGEDFKPSDSSKALAGIIGGGGSASDLTQRQASKPVYGFTPPTATTSSASDQGHKLASKPVFGFKPPASMLAPSSIPELGQKLASKPVFGFNPPTPGMSEGPRGPELASKPLFGFQPPAAMEKKNSGSVFDNPTPADSNGGFVNPFTSQKPDPSDRDMDDEGSDSDNKKPSGASNTGSLFGRASEPKPSNSLSESVFGTPTKTSTSTGGLFSNRLDQTWSPDRGVKFESANGNRNGSIFSAKSSGEAKPATNFFDTGSSTSSAVTTPGASSIFGTPGPKAEVGFSFGGNGTTKPSGPISIPTSRETTATPEESSEPNDNAHLAKNEVDLSAQGPGEEEEDSLFQVRAIIYEIVGGGVAPKKAGVGTLRVLKNRITGKARVVTRTEGGKVVLNVGLVKEVVYGLGEKRGKNVSVVEFLAGSKPKRFSVRVKEEEVAKQLGEIMDDAKGS